MADQQFYLAAVSTVGSFTRVADRRLRFAGDLALASAERAGKASWPNTANWDYVINDWGVPSDCPGPL